MADIHSARAFWDNEIVDPTHTPWMAHPLVRLHLNRCIDPAQPAWPIEWFARHVGNRRFRRGLSIGCGGGALERSLIDHDLCTIVDAFDASVHSLYLAKQEARRRRMGNRIRYFAADFNEALFLPRHTYDIVFFHQSLHHVAKLEKLLRAVLLTLKPGGLLYLDEYVGPSRTDWTEALIEPQEREYARIPRELRRTERLALPIQEDDPSEAIRSGEIMEQVRVGFDIVEQRDYGGNLLAVVYPNLEQADDRAVSEMIEREQEWLRAGAASYYTILLARPKSGRAASFASLQYFAAPKLKRIARVVRRTLGQPSV